MTAMLAMPAVSGPLPTPRAGCHPDPYIDMAVDVMKSAMRELRKWWQEGKPIYNQPSPAQEALAFLVFGIEGPMPFLYHDLVGLESIAEMEPEQSIALFLKARHKKIEEEA